MPRMLLLAAGGFAGAHLRSAAESDAIEVIGTSRRAGEAELRCDLLDPASIERAIQEAKPDLIANLAGAASVAASWQDPAEAFQAHATGTANLLDQVSRHAEEARVLCVSSGEVYGAVSEGDQPITEDEPPRPVNPYAASKRALEEICATYERARGVRTVVARAFSHTGPGQSEAFAPSAFARQVAMAEIGGDRALRLTVGDLSPRRDFTDVRDIVHAYLLLLMEGPAGPLNVCSGKAIEIGGLIDLLAEATALRIETSAGKERLRPVDVPLMCGSPTALQRETGWTPTIPLRQTMRDVLDWWRARLRR
jgi:GDP-4-dehydro-6-deoxy-D-mannose reductase